MNRLLIFLIVISAGWSWAASQPRIEVDSWVAITEKAPVYFSQVTRTQGLSESVQKKLSQIQIASAPSAGAVVNITQAGLSTLLRTHLPELQKLMGGKIMVQLPEKLQIQAVLPYETAAVQSSIRAELAKYCDGCEFEFLEFRLPEQPQSASGIYWQVKVEPATLKEHFYLPIDFIKEGQRLRRDWVRGRFRVLKEVPVAQRMIERGTPIAEQDLRIEKREVPFQHKPIPTIEDIQRSVAQIGLPAGAIITADALTVPKVLKYGQMVQVISREGSIEIVTEGVTQQPAAIGDVIRVKLPQSNRVVSARVESKDTVVIQ